MVKKELYSDHEYKWSEKQINFNLTSKTYDTDETFSYYRAVNYTRLFNRAIQALWQARMPMYARQRTWSQILFNAQYLQRETGCYIRSFRSARESKKVSFSFSEDSRNTQGSWQHQPRASQKERNFLRRSNGYGGFFFYRVDKGDDCSTCRQYAPGISFGFPKHFIAQGGEK